MQLPRRGQRRSASRALAGVAAAALLPALAFTATTSATADPGAGADSGTDSTDRAEPGASPLVLRAPDKVTTWSYDGMAYTGFGLRLVAPEDPFEIRSHRASWNDEIVSTWLSPEGPQTLPAGTMTRFDGLQDFITVKLRRAKGGKAVDPITLNGCLNGDSQRVSPDAPARSPYPYGCPWNPYTIGSVMGIEGGYASAVVEEWSTALPLKPGKYDVTAAISPKYVELFGIAAEDASEELRLVVKREDGRGKAAKHPGDDPEAPLPPADEEPDGDVEPPAGPRPDLQSLPAWDIQLNRKGTTLRFAATVWNAGDSPMVVDGFRGEGERDMTAYQYFFDTDGEQVGYERVGEMHWHAENHQHWHFEDFAQYRLLSLDQEEVVLSSKQSFCLANTDAVDYTVPGADWHPENTDLSTACGGNEAISVRQVLSAGSGDTYHQFRYGQAFPIKNVPDGTYYIAVQANPMRNLVESDTTNNDSLRKIRLTTTKKGERRVKVAPVGIIEETMPEWFGRSLYR